VIAAVAWWPLLHLDRIPVLWTIDLGFHELGHLIGYVTRLPELVTAVAGNGLQTLAPLLAAGVAAYRRRWALAAAALAWAGGTLIDASNYIADAPYERLELLGGDHDWAFALGPGRLDALSAVPTIVSVLRVAAWVLVVAAVVVLAVSRRVGSDR